MPRLAATEIYLAQALGRLGPQMPPARKEPDPAKKMVTAKNIDEVCRLLRVAKAEMGQGKNVPPRPVTPYPRSFEGTP